MTRKVTLYKLTDQGGYTRRGMSGETLWAPGRIVTAKGSGGLGTAGVVHAYRHPELGVAMNPAHANIGSPRMWKCEGVIREDDGTKVGVRRLRCLEELKCQPIPITALTRWSIYMVQMALPVNSLPEWDRWASDWLSGYNRSKARATAWAAGAAGAGTAGAAAGAARAARTTNRQEWSGLTQALLLQAWGEEEDMWSVEGRMRRS